MKDLKSTTLWRVIAHFPPWGGQSGQTVTYFYACESLGDAIDAHLAGYSQSRIEEISRMGTVKLAEKVGEVERG